MTVKDLYLVLPENQVIYIEDNAKELKPYSGMADDIPLELFNKNVVDVESLDDSIIYIACE